MTGVRVFPGCVPLSRGPPPHAGPSVCQQPVAETRIQRGQRGAPRDEGWGGPASAEGEYRGPSIVDVAVVVVLMSSDCLSVVFSLFFYKTSFCRVIDRF